jgi:CBS-domain-containing membrane protein
VYRYAAGKADWLAAGLPAEGKDADAPTAGTLAERQVPTCRASEPLTDIRARLAGGSRRDCVVVDAQRVVLGYLAPDRLTGGGLAGEAMDPAPSTIRPSASPEKVLDFLGDDGQHILVTTPEGELIGAVTRDVVEGLGAKTPRVRQRARRRRPARRRAAR